LRLSSWSKSPYKLLILKNLRPLGSAIGRYRGETFSGVDYEAGLQAVEKLRTLVPEGMTMAQFALRWILMFDAVTCAIPGAKRPAQVEDNARAADSPLLTDETMSAINEIYDRRIRALVHHYW
jgi:aryl-alcohol dehydrogenase-like predicted oxidoreductase